MPESRILPSVPEVRLELVEEMSPAQPSGFLRLVRRRLVAIGPDGSTSAPFVYDEVDRAALDAVVVATYFVSENGQPQVYLRSATRPPVAMRSRHRQLYPEHANRRGLWELVAGLVEQDESSPEGIVACARRELEEELGFDEIRDLRPLGPSTHPAPGVIGERHYFFAVEVDPKRQKVPSSDGSALEQLSAITVVSLRDALAACANGEIEDAKSELGLRRLSEYLGRLA